MYTGRSIAVIIWALRRSLSCNTNRNVALHTVQAIRGSKLFLSPITFSSGWHLSQGIALSTFPVESVVLFVSPSLRHTMSPCNSLEVRRLCFSQFGSVSYRLFLRIYMKLSSRNANTTAFYYLHSPEMISYKKMIFGLGSNAIIAQVLY